MVGVSDRIDKYMPNLIKKKKIGKLFLTVFAVFCVSIKDV